MVERNRYLVGIQTTRGALLEHESLTRPHHLGIIVPTQRVEAIASLFGHYEQGEGTSPAHVTLIYPRVTDAAHSTNQILYCGGRDPMLGYLSHVLEIDERHIGIPTQSTFALAGIENIIMVATTADAEKFVYPALRRYPQAGIAVVEINDRDANPSEIPLGANSRELVSPDRLIKTVERYVGAPRVG